MIARRAEVEDLRTAAVMLPGRLLGAERVDASGHGMRGADRVRHLELAPVGEPGATTFFAT
jgi:hypothetical protein